MFNFVSKYLSFKQSESPRSVPSDFSEFPPLLDIHKYIRNFTSSQRGNVTAFCHATFDMSSRSSASSSIAPLIVSLENPSEDGSSYQTIRVSCGDEYLDIELRRTIRLPSDDAIRCVPQALGASLSILLISMPRSSPSPLKEEPSYQYIVRCSLHLTLRLRIQRHPR